MMKKIVKDVRPAALILAFKRKGGWSFILAFLLLSLVFLTNAGAKEPLVMPDGPAVSVDAVEVETFEPVFKPSDDGLAPRPNHPPFDQIPAEDMPYPPEIEKKIDLSGPRGICYPDPVTGETVFVEVPDPGQWTDEIVRVPGFDGADGGSGVVENYTINAFVDMTKVGSPQNDPYRRNVKLVVRYEDASNNDHFSRCSGSMIDAETVQTAGHCVYDHNNSWGWAKEVWVYPGWDGVGGQSNLPPSIINHYGYGRATGANIAAAAGYVLSKNLDDDLGLVGIDRAVGMLTGWFLRERGPDCDGIKPVPHYNCSYPKECCNPPSCTLHTGTDMYYWSGYFDSCPSNLLRINTTGGCFNAGWGGMSGSGAYIVSGSNRYIHAVASSSDRATRFDFCRLWTWWIDWTDDTFIPQVRGSNFDLQALDMNAESSTIQAGNNTTLLNHLATNSTNGSSSSRTRTYRVYLSSNDYITTADTLLSTQQYTWGFVPMQNVRVGMVQVTIPGNTPAGDYWLGVIYDSGTDGVSSNNDTSGWDAQRITVTGSAPPTPASISYPSSDNDGNFTVSWSSSSGATSYTLQRATNASFTGAVTVYSGASTSYNQTGLSNGTYYYRVSASNVYGSSGWRNGGPIVVSLSLSPPTPASISYPSSDNDGDFTVSWSSSSGATSYTLQRATNASFTGAVTEYSGPSTSYNQTGLGDGTYYYRVSASNVYGSSGWRNGGPIVVSSSAIFQDVPLGHWAYDAIYKIYNAGITKGCSVNPLMYCPDKSVSKAAMAVFLLRSLHGGNYTPPPATGIFTDVNVNEWYAPWVEQLYKEGITKGCSESPLMYCPDRDVSKASMALFLLRSKYGVGYIPPAATGIFTDVPLSHWGADWIEKLYNDGITQGCSASPLMYCPDRAVSRAAMALFLVRTFGF